MRSGPWKLYLPDRPGAPVRLYNLVEDLTEQHDQAANSPELVARLQALLDQARADLGEGDQRGANVRTGGPSRVGDPAAQVS